MMKYYLLVAFALTCCLPCSLLHAQEFTISEPLDISRDSECRIVGSYNDNILVFRQQRFQDIIQAFDANLNVSWHKNIELSKQNINMLGIIADKTFWTVLFYYFERGKTVLEAAQFDGDGNVITQQRIAMLNDRYTLAPEQIVVSENKQTMALYTLALDGQMEILLCDVPTLRTYWHGNFVWEGLNFTREFVQLVTANSGTVYLMFDQHASRRRLQKHQLQFVVIDTTKLVSKFSIPCTDALLYSADAVYDEKNQQLVIVGFASNDNISASGFFYARTNGVDTPTLRITPMDEPFLRSFTGIGRKNLSGVGHLETKRLILRQDGGVIMLAEQVIVQTYELTTGFYPSTQPMPSVAQADYLYENVLVASFHPTGELHWKSVLHKSQDSENDQGRYSSFVLLKNQSALRLLYNNEITTQPPLYDFSINGKGEGKRQLLDIRLDRDVLLQFAKGVQIAANQCIVPSERNNKLRLVRIAY